VALVRGLDMERRRHVYGAGAPPSTMSTWELGALAPQTPDRGIAVWVDSDGRVAIEGTQMVFEVPSPARAARWVVAPLRWAGFGRRRARARAVVRRALLVRRIIAPGEQSSETLPSGPASGWLFPEWASGRVALYGATHPITGDLLLTRYPEEASESGYGEPRLLGFLLAEAPATGNLDRPPTSIPWASRFAERVRWGIRSENDNG
jgi:hypothetical protein